MGAVLAIIDRNTGQTIRCRPNEPDRRGKRGQMQVILSIQVRDETGFIYIFAMIRGNQQGIVPFSLPCDDQAIADLGDSAISVRVQA